MARRPYSGEEIAKALRKWDFQPVDREGSHLKLRYVDPNTGEKRMVSVPIHDELATGTLRKIAEQSGANNFQAFLDAIEDLV